MATMIEKYEELEFLVNKLKKNKSSIPEKEQMGRYKKAFQKLEKEILHAGDALFPYMMVSGFHFLPEDSKAFYRAAGQVAVQAKKNGYSAHLQAALVTCCDMELFHAYALYLQSEIAERFYVDYWLSHTTEVNGRFFNDLVQMYYDEASEIWTNDEQCSFGLFFPPEKEAFLQRLREDRDELAAFIAERTAVPVCCHA